MGGVKGREITRKRERYVCTYGVWLLWLLSISISINNPEACVFALFVLLFSTVPTRCATLQANCRFESIHHTVPVRASFCRCMPIAMAIAFVDACVVEKLLNYCSLALFQKILYWRAVVENVTKNKPGFGELAR